MAKHWLDCLHISRWLISNQETKGAKPGETLNSNLLSASQSVKFKQHKLAYIHIVDYAVLGLFENKNIYEM